MRITMAMKTGYPDPIKRAFAERLLGLEWLDVIEPAVIELQELADEDASIVVRDHYVSLYQTMAAPSDTAELRSRVEARGWRASERTPVDVPEANLRIYRYTKVWNETEVAIHLSISFTESRYVQIGSSEVPEYALVEEPLVTNSARIDT